MGSHSSASLRDPLTYAGYKDVPVSYLICEKDMTIPTDSARDMIELIEREGGNKVDEVDCGGEQTVRSGYFSTLPSIEINQGIIRFVRLKRSFRVAKGKERSWSRRMSSSTRLL